MPQGSNNRSHVDRQRPTVDAVGTRRIRPCCRFRRRHTFRLFFPVRLSQLFWRTDAVHRTRSHRDHHCSHSHRSGFLHAFRRVFIAVPLTSLNTRSQPIVFRGPDWLNHHFDSTVRDVRGEPLPLGSVGGYRVRSTFLGHLQTASGQAARRKLQRTPDSPRKGKARQESISARIGNRSFRENGNACVHGNTVPNHADRFGRALLRSNGKESSRPRRCSKPGTRDDKIGHHDL